MNKKIKAIVLGTIFTCLAGTGVCAKALGDTSDYKAKDTVIPNFLINATKTPDNLNISTDTPEIYTSEQDFDYEKNQNGTYKIIKYKGDKAKIVIPCEIEGIKVTAIGDQAFYNCDCLTEISIPGSVNSIGESAFELCSSLKKVTISSGVKSIGRYAFYCCGSLSEITLPDSLTELGDYAFNCCESLSKINLSKNLNSISKGTFGGCNSLKYIKIPQGVKVIKSHAFEAPDLTIPDVECDSNYNFDDFIKNYSLRKILIPDSVSEIDDNAFYECKYLIIYGKKNSYAEEFAKKNNIEFKLSSEYEKDILSENSKKQYNVTFINDDGQIIKTVKVNEGEAAEAPSSVQKEGYIFKGWDKEFNCITSDTEVKAVFEKEEDIKDATKTEAATSTNKSTDTIDGNPNKTGDPKGVIGVLSLFGIISLAASVRKKTK